jgi:Putative zinc- or iron-chelating domain
MDEVDDPRASGRFVFDVTVSTLKTGTDVDSCTSLVAKAGAGFEKTFDGLRNKGARIACKSGCNFCCHLRVTVTPPEAIALFRYLRTEVPDSLAQEVEQRIMANAEQISAMGEERHVSTNLKCAFLVDGICSAYRARPMACALHHSLDLDACQKVFENPSDHSLGVRRLKIVEDTKAATQAGLNEALEKLGLGHEPIELHTAVAAILRDPSLIARWRSGSPLLKPAKPMP